MGCSKTLRFVLGLSIVISAASLRAGTSAKFLTIDVAPQIAGLGGGSVAVQDASFAEINPACVKFVDGSLISFAHSSWFEGISLHGFSLATANARHGLRISVTGLYGGKLEKYDEDDRYLGEFRYFDFVIGATYARSLGDLLTIGLRGKTIYEKIDWDSATGLGFDLGAITNPDLLPMGRLAFGFAVRNLGPRFGFTASKHDLPLTLQAGVTYTLAIPYGIKAVLSADYKSERDGEKGTVSACELTFHDVLVLRAGYARGRERGDVTFGLGVRVSRINFDYAAVDYGEGLGTTHRFAISLGMGRIFPSPEESR